jgi:hypothetical protein
MNYVAAAKLNWDPFGTDVDLVAKNFIGTNSDFAVTEDVWKALDLTQDFWEEFCVDFDGFIFFADCARIHGMFGLKRAKTLSLPELQERLQLLSKHAAMMNEAAQLMQGVEKRFSGTDQEALFIKDIVYQTKIFADFIESRKLLAEAFIAKQERDFETMAAKFRQVIALDEQISTMSMNKPNISDDFEFEGMAQAWLMPVNIDPEIKELQEMSTPEAIEAFKNTLTIYGSPKRFDMLGKAGKTQTVSFEIPQQAETFSRFVLQYTVKDIDGKNPGDEAVLRAFGEEHPIAPTDGGHQADCELPIANPLTPGVHTIEFVLAGTPDNTRGYFVENCAVVLTK